MVIDLLASMPGNILVNISANFPVNIPVNIPTGSPLNFPVNIPVNVLVDAPDWGKFMEKLMAKAPGPGACCLAVTDLFLIRKFTFPFW